jgi:hypothetical protein
MIFLARFPSVPSSAWARGVPSGPREAPLRLCGYGSSDSGELEARSWAEPDLALGPHFQLSDGCFERCGGLSSWWFYAAYIRAKF